MKNFVSNKLQFKIIAVLLVLGLTIMPIVSAQVVLNAEVSVRDVKLTVRCGAYYAGKNITVQVFKPTGSLSDLSGNGYGETDSDKIHSALGCVYHAAADENGDVVFTYSPTGDKGRYFVRISGEGMYVPTETSFEFISENDAEYVIEKLVGSPSINAIEKLFEKPENINVYKPYQILGLDKSAMYEEYENAPSGIKTKIYEHILLGINADMDITPSGFTSLFEESVLVECLNTVNGEGIFSYIDKYASALKLTDKKEYTNIYRNSERFDTSAKAIFRELVEKANLSGLSVNEVSADICEGLFTSVLSGINSPGVLDSLIKDFSTELARQGANITAYNSSGKQIEVCRALIGAKPFASASEFAVKLNGVLSSGTIGEQWKKPQSPSGSRGGSVYTVDAKITPAAPDTDNTDTAVFSDIGDVAWAHEAIAALKSRGVISGRTDRLFAPGDSVTREEFVKMVVLALNISTDGQYDKETFSDVTDAEWFAPYVYTAYNSGIVTGHGGVFGIGEPITRQDMAVICARALKLLKFELREVRTGMSFSDSISDYALKDVSELWSAGLINGYSETLFAPFDTATRAQAAKLLYEVLNAIKMA